MNVEWWNKRTVRKLEKYLYTPRIRFVVVIIICCYKIVVRRARFVFVFDLFSTRTNIIIRNGKRWEKDEREFRNVRNQTKERGREGGDRRSVMRARRSHVKKVSVRTSVNISLRKQSIEIVGEKDDALTRGPATRKERLITL